MRPTMRAADGGESVRFTGSYLAPSFFCSQTFLSARPLSAANAYRWATNVSIYSEMVTNETSLDPVSVP
jgi:hypothetical protein